MNASSFELGKDKGEESETKIVKNLMRNLVRFGALLLASSPISIYSFSVTSLSRVSFRSATFHSQGVSWRLQAAGTGTKIESIRLSPPSSDVNAPVGSTSLSEILPESTPTPVIFLRHLG